jgi:hypothetical protein
MTTPTETISLNDVEYEIYGTRENIISLNDDSVRKLAAMASTHSSSGQPISLNDLRGKTRWIDSGTFLRQYCSGYDLHSVYADGNYGEYDNLTEANSTTCGFIANYHIFDYSANYSNQGNGDINFTVDWVSMAPRIIGRVANNANQWQINLTSRNTWIYGYEILANDIFGNIGPNTISSAYDQNGYNWSINFGALYFPSRTRYAGCFTSDNRILVAFNTGDYGFNDDGANYAAYYQVHYDWQALTGTHQEGTVDYGNGDSRPAFQTNPVYTIQI